MTIEGECFCGGVSYSISRPLGDVRSCHCSRCRKAFSSQASAYAVIDPQHFEWKTGEELLTLYQNQYGYGLKFCKVCGSTLCGAFNGEVHGITLGCVNGDPGIEIGMHIFVGSKAKWEVMPEGVLQYEEAMPDET